MYYKIGERIEEFVPKTFENLDFQYAAGLSTLLKKRGITGTVDDLQKIPGVNVKPEINAKIRDMFRPHITEYINFHKSSPKQDKSPVLDLGTYMDNYEE